MIFYGRNVVKEALSSPRSVQKVFAQMDINNKDERIESILSLTVQRRVPIVYLPLKELQKKCNSDETQGVAAEVVLPFGKLREIQHDTNSSYIYISAVTYEHNVGAIIRSSECSGIKGVIIPKNVSLTPTIAKVSTGAIFHIPLYSESIFNTIKFFQSSGYQVVGIERDGIPYFKADLTGNNLFIIGGEDKSLSDAVRKKTGIIAEIPQHGKVNSLNMSVATGIILFERVRQLSDNS